MSIQALNWALAQDHIENSATRFVLLVLCNYADEIGQCYPSRENISQKTSLSIRSVQRHLNWLVANKFLSKKQRRSDVGQTSNLYKILGVRMALTPIEQGDNDGQKPQKQGDTLAHYTKDIRDTKDKILDVFEYWKKELNHPAAKLDNPRRRIIEKRFETFSINDLKKAIDGCKKSPWHSGKNPDSKIYDKISLIFRNDEKVEEFISYTNASNGKPQMTEEEIKMREGVIKSQEMFYAGFEPRNS